jgi:DNA-binding beta-propeller fold protein YncE
VLPSRDLEVNKVRQFDLPCMPYGVDIDEAGQIAVCGRDDKVHIYKKDGTELSQITPGGRVCDVATTRDKLYITQWCHSQGKLYIYSKGGVLIKSVTVGYEGHAGVAINKTHIYITSSYEDRVYRLDLGEGTDKTVFIDQGLSYPHFVSCTDSKVAVSSYNSHQVSVHDIEGRLQFIYGGLGTGPGQLKYPWGVALDRWDQLLIADNDNKRISIVSPQGQHLRDIRLDQEGLSYPRGLAITRDGQVLVGCNKKLAIFQYLKI